MKLSSSTLCGCCFCCYCHCWLMMLLMVSSVVHVSPEMSTTLTSTTTTTKKYTKLYNNNNYAYQSEMTEEFIQLNRKISNRTKSREVVATATTTSSSPTFPSTAMLPLLPQIHEPVATTTTITTGDYHYKPNNEQSIIKFEHETITTIATIQTQQSTISTSHLHATATTTPAIPLATTTTMISTLTLAPEQIQMNKKQQNPYKKVETKHSENVEREEEEESNVYTFDNSIEEEEEAEVTTSRTITTTTNYAADNSHVFVPPTILSIESTTEHFVKPMKKILSNNKNNNSSNNNNNNVKSTKYWNISIDLQPNKTRNQQQENNTSNSKSKSSDNNNSNTSSSSNSDNSLNNHNEGSKDFVNSNYRSSNSKQKTTTNTFSLNHNDRYGTVNKNNNNNNSSTNISTSTSINFVTQNHVATKIENGTATTTTTRVLNATAINSLPSSGTFDFHNKTSKTHNFKNHNNKNSKNNNNNSSNNYYDSIATSTDSDSNLSPNEMNQYTDITKTHHHNQHRPQLQMPTTSLSAATATTTALRIPTTYTPLHEYHGHSQMTRPVLLHRHARQAAGAAATDDEQNDKCRMFVEGDPEKNELYSPDYPNDYPKNINCTRVIIAPKGQIIRLDFRNSFHIEEKEECKFDFLEIRDGQYGFSNLIGKFCGTDFPPEITSKERYLWLHFHSDESIEYSGFTAVYEFIDRNRDAPSTDLNCTIERDGFEGFVNASDVPTEIKETVIRNKIPLDCMWRIQVQEKWKIQVKFVDFKLAKPNDCESNFLDIFPEQTVMPLRVKNFCGSAGEGITSESNILHVRFYAEQSAITSSFSILYTAFRERGSSSCAEDEYDCEDATCIAGNLKCNGRSNCKFLWDEEGCKPEDNGQSEHMIIIITVFGLILGGMVITFLVNCVRKIMHDQKIIREHIRQSKESKLDEMGRNSKGRSRDNISIVSPRQKHSQTSLQILDDVSNRYYREIEMQTKSNFKEKDPSILRHDMIVQTSLCSTDDSSTTTTTEHQQQQQQQQQQTQPTGVGSSACDMGCQTRESLIATASLMRQKSKTPSLVGSQRTIEGVPPPPRFSTFGYDAAQIAPPPPPTVSTLSRRNMHLPQETLEMEQLPQQTTHTMMMMMPHQQHHQHPQQQQHPQHQQHQHLHHRPSQEICHHHHQHQQHLQQQQQKQTLPRHHQQQQQQQQQLPQHHQHMQQQQQQQHHQYHTSSTTIPPNVTQTPAQPPGTAVVTAISTGSSGRQREQQGTGGSTAGKNKQTKVDESKVFIDIRNSAPDVIIMTSH